MDRACEDDETRQLSAGPGFMPVVPPRSNRTALEIRLGPVQTAQRVREPVPAAQELPGASRASTGPTSCSSVFIGFVFVIDALQSVNMP